MSEYGWIVSIVGVVVSAIALAYTVNRNKKLDVEAIKKEVADGKERLVKLETKVDVFWKGVGFDAAKILHSPHPEHARRDYLIERFMDERLTKEEMEELIRALIKARDDENVLKGERVAASIMLRAMEQRYAE